MMTSRREQKFIGHLVQSQIVCKVVSPGDVNQLAWGYQANGDRAGAELRFLYS